MKRFLATCVEVEETVAKIYHKVAESPRLGGELRQVLKDLASDEEDHAQQIRFAMRFPAGTALVEKPVKLEEIKNLLARAKALYTKISTAQLTDKQAIELGIILEGDFCQAHLGNSMEFRDENLKNMFAALAKDDEKHTKKLRDLKERIG